MSVLTSCVQPFCDVHNALHLISSLQLHLIPIPEGREDVLVDPVHELLLVKRNLIPSRLHSSSAHLQIMILFHCHVPLHSLSVVLEEREQQDVPSVRQDITIEQNCVKKAIRRENVDIKQQEVRCSNALDANITKSVDRVDGTIVLLPLSPVVQKWGCFGLFDDVDTVVDSPSLLCDNELSEGLRLILVNEEHCTDGSFPSPQQVGETVSSIHPGNERMCMQLRA